MEVPPGYSRKLVLAPLTEEELNAVTVVFHQYETGLREGCIFTKVVRSYPLISRDCVQYAITKLI